MGNLLVNRRDIVTAIAVVKDSDHSAMSTDDRAHDAALGTAVGADRPDLYKHAVPVHRRAHRGRRNENVS